MTITDAMIHYKFVGNGIRYVIAGIVFLVGGITFGYFFEKERRQVIDIIDRKARLILHAVTVTLILAGLWLGVLYGARWLIGADSYVVYETTVIDKARIGTNLQSRNNHIVYQVYFEGTSTIQVFRPVKKDIYDSVNIGDRALIIDGIGNSYLDVYYGEGYNYEGTHMIDLD